MKFLKEIYKDNGRRTERKLLASQTFHRGKNSPRKIIISRKGCSHPDFILRVPESPDSNIKKETEILEDFRKKSDIKKFIPWTKYYEYPFISNAQEWVLGQRYLDSSNPQKVNMAVNFLKLIQKETSRKNQKDFKQHISEFSLPESLKKKANDELKPITCFSHGDFSPTNIIISSDGLRIVDWEDFNFKSYPLYDPTHFVFMEEILKKKSFPTPDSFFNSLKQSLLSNQLLDTYRKKVFHFTNSEMDLYIPFYLYQRLQRYKSALKLGHWKKRYLILYEGLLEEALNSLQA